jgi:hypothetical protein
VAPFALEIGAPFKYHLLPEEAEDVKSTLSPRQKLVGPPAVMVGVEGITLTVINTEDLHPLLFV